MNDLAYLWEEEDPIRDRFVLFLVLSIGLHVALHFMPVGARDAQDADVRDVPRDRAVAAPEPIENVRFDIREATMALPSFAAELALAKKALEPAPERPEIERETLAPPAGTRQTAQGLSVSDRTSRSQTALLEAPKAPRKKLPDPGRFKPRTFREQLKRTVVERQQRTLVKVVRDPDQPTPDKQARPKLHPKKSLLNDPVPSPKPAIPALMERIMLLNREEFQPTADTTPSFADTDDVRLLPIDATPPLKPLQFGPDAQASHRLLPLPRLSMPKAVSLTGDGKDLPPGWTAAGLGAYKRGLQAKLISARTYPRQSLIRKEQGIVTVRFVIKPTGQMEAAYIHISSDFPRLDTAALVMLRKASPFPPFPKTALERQLFTVDIVFSLVGD